MKLFLLIPVLTLSAAQIPSFERQMIEVRRAILPGQDEQRKTRLMSVAADGSQSVDKRVDALKELRTWAPNDTGVVGIMEGLIRDQDEPLPVRLRSAKSLGMAITSPGKQYAAALSILLDISREPGAPLALRAMSVKALHWATDKQEWVTSEFLDWAKPGHPAELREAAVWALASARPQVTKELLAFLNERNESLKLRLQALKSLYPSRDVEAIRQRVSAIAVNVSEAPELRETARLFQLDSTGRSDLWIFFRLRHEPVTFKVIEVLEYE